MKDSLFLEFFILQSPQGKSCSSLWVVLTFQISLPSLCALSPAALAPRFPSDLQKVVPSPTVSRQGELAAEGIKPHASSA